MGLAYHARAVVARCAQIAASTRFQAFIFAVIVVNAIALGLGPYPARCGVSCARPRR
jgi:hypothetical protein